MAAQPAEPTGVAAQTCTSRYPTAGAGAAPAVAAGAIVVRHRTVTADNAAKTPRRMHETIPPQGRSGAETVALRSSSATSAWQRPGTPGVPGRSSLRSERAHALRGAEAGRTVPAGDRGAPGRRRAGAVRTGRDVVQRTRLAPGVGRGVVAGGRSLRVDAGDDRRGGAGAAELHPARVALVGVGVVDRDARVGVGDGRDVRGRLAGALRAHLVALLRVHRRAPGAGPAPRGLAPTAGRGVLGQRGAADRDHRRERGRRGDAVAVVTGRGGDRDALVVVGRRVARTVAAAVTVADRDDPRLLGRVVLRG